MKPFQYPQYLFFLLFLINGTGATIYGQTPPQNIKTADSLFKLGEKYDAVDDVKLALPLFESSLAIYESLGKPQNVGNCLNYIGTIHAYKGDYSKAMSSFTKSAEVYKNARYKKGVANALNNVAAVYGALGNYPQTIEYLRQAATIQEEIGATKTSATATIIGNLASIYSKIKDYPNTMKYANKASAIFKEINNKNGIAKILIETGCVSMEQGNFDRAFEEFNQSLTIAEKEKYKQLEIEVLSNLGELFYRQSDFQKALYYYNRCFKEAEKNNIIRYKSISQIAIGNVLHQLKRDKEAIDKCALGLTIAEKLGAISIKKDACECLYKSYESLKNDQLALRYYKQLNVFEDSLQTVETSNRMMNMEFQKQQLADSVAYVKKENIAQLKYQTEIQKKEKQRNIIIASLCFMLLVAVGLWSRLNFVRKSKEALKLEKDRSEALLLNILPEEIAEELKATGSVKAKDFGLVSILFTDFQSFTQTAQTMSPQRLVEEINVCFEAFDRISEKYQIEKIKTIGDAYMAAGGMANADENTPKNVVLAGLEMQAFIAQRAIENQQYQKPYFEMRLGIHAGPIVAGIVGVKKFQYDVWGDTVNTASRMESNGTVGKVNISEAFYELIKDDPRFCFEYRGNISAKGKGEINMYFVEKNDE